MFRKSQTEATLDEETVRVLETLKTAPDDDAYVARLDTAERLQKMKIAEAKSSPRVSPDTMFSAGVNLATVAMILKHEHLHVITSKAFSFVTKLRP